MKKIIAAAVIEQEKILLVDNHRNWSFPGGTREEGESDLECLSREFSEEFSGTKIKVTTHYGTFKGISPRKRDQITVEVYFAEIKGQLNMPDGSDEDVKMAEWIDDPSKYQLAPVAHAIIDSLQRDNYL